MTVIKRIAVIAGSLGTAAMFLCAGDPSPRSDVNDTTSLGLFLGGFALVALSVLVWRIVSLVEYRRAERERLRRKYTRTGERMYIDRKGHVYLDSTGKVYDSIEEANRDVAPL